MNWIIVTIVAIFGIAIVVFTIIRNQKDEINLEEKMNNNYPKPNDQKGEFDNYGL